MPACAAALSIVRAGGACSAARAARRLIWMLAVLAMAVRAVAAEPYQKLAPSDYTPGSFIEFGASLALDGDTLAVGDPSATFGGAETGAVYVFERRRGSWVESAKLGPKSVSYSIDFGRHVALAGDRLAISGSYLDVGATDAGGVYVFERRAGRWSQDAVLTASPPVAGELLGESLALSGNTVAAGTVPQIVPTARDSRVKVFDRDPRSGHWGASGTLVDPGGGDPFAFPHGFGIGLAFSGAELAIPAGFGRGDPYAIYLRTRAPSGSWRKAGKLLTPAAGAAERNWDPIVWLAATPDRLVAGAPSDYRSTGAVYVWDRGGNGIGAPATLTAAVDPRPNSAPSFGRAVAVAGDRVVATATEDDRGWGAAYLWERGGARWKLRAKLTVRDEELPHGQLGRAVALDDRTLAVSTTVGFPWEVPRPAGGAVYVTDLDGIAR